MGMTSELQQVDPKTLKPHPENERIYASRSVDDLVQSIRQQGILVPLVATPNMVLLSGHRRHRAALELGLSEVPVQIREPADEILTLVGYNCQRAKSWTEMYREVEIAAPRLKMEAVKRQREGGRRGSAKRHGQASANACRTHVGTTRDQLGKLVGLSGESTRKMQAVFQAVEVGMVPRDVQERLDRGEVTLNQAFRQLNRAKKQAAAKEKLEQETRAGTYSIDDLIKPYDLWMFLSRDRRFGGTNLPEEQLDGEFGSPPPQAIVNLLHLYTSEGDLVVDPMAGGGTTSDVCRYMRRSCLSFDLTPRRSDIQRHDLLTGFPNIGERKPQLIVLDMPYGDQKEYSEEDHDLSRSKDLDEFLARAKTVIRHSLQALDPERGRLAVIMGNGSAFRRRNIDLSWMIGRQLESEADIETRIQVPYGPGFHPGYRVDKAKAERQLLSLSRELFIVRPRTMINPTNASQVTPAAA